MSLENHSRACSACRRGLGGDGGSVALDGLVAAAKAVVGELAAFGRASVVDGEEAVFGIPFVGLGWQGGGAIAF